MKVGVPKENRAGEARVALVPDMAKLLKAKGHQVLVQAGAGLAAGYGDEVYVQAGAELVANAASVLGSADVVLKMNKPGISAEEGGDEVAQMKPGAGLIGFLQPFSSPELLQKLVKHNITAFSMELVPRISRAQNMDALTSMATVGGYKAVLLGANHLHKFMPMFMSAAGTIPAARVLVLGAGVAGLQAIATARRLGGVVEAFDTRPVVKEQVESLGAKFIALEVDHAQAQDAGGYAKELSADHHRRELELIAGRLEKADLVITTAQIPGKKAPLLITQDMLSRLRPGSVVVDMAAESGGNCAATPTDKITVQQGVTYIGIFNLANLMPTHASMMYARNMANLLNHLADAQGLKLEMAEEITRGCLVTHQGKVVHPALAG